MTPVIHCSIASLNLFPRTTFIRRREFHITRCSVSKKYIRPSSSSQRFLSCQLSPQFFQIYRNGCGPYHGSRVQIIAAVGTDVTVEESNSVVSGEDADEPSETASRSTEASENVRTTPATTAKSKRPRPARKSEMPPVKNEELVPGATFTGKVRSIQPFGAFVDFGAFTDGLVHVSRMSDGYVKDVGALVSVGQEVKVRIVEANMESGRISLSMRDSDDVRKPQQRKEASFGGNNEKQRPTRKTAARSTQKRDDVQKTSKFVRGQILDGTVKNITRSGAFVSLPEGEEGFLPVSEESEGFGNILGNSSLQVGQEVNVRVLRISRGQVTLTMKKVEDVEKLNMQLSQGVVHVATNPFELAFRKNEDIAAFLDEQEKIQKSSESSSLSKTSKEKEGKLDEITKKSDSAEVESSLTDSVGNQVGVSSATGLELEDEKTSSQEQHEEAPITDSSSVELVSNVDEPVSSLTPDSIGVTESLAEETSSIPEAGMGDDEEPVITSAENTKLVPETLAGEDESSTTSIGSSSDTVPEEASVAEGIKASHSATDIVEEQIISSNASVSKGSESATDGLSSSLAKDEISVTSEVNEEVSNSESYVADEVSVSDEVRETDGTIGTVPEEDVSSADSVSTTDSVASKDSLEVNGTSSSTGSSGEIKEEPTSVEGASSEKIVTSQSNGPSLDDKVGDGTTIPVENEMVSDDSKDGISVTSEGNEEVSNPESYVTDEVSVSDEVRETDGTIGTVPEEDVSSVESVSTTDSVASKDSLEVNGNSTFTGSSGEIKEEPTSVEGVSSEKIVTSQSNGPSVDDKVEDGTTIPVENEMAPDDSKDVKVEVMETSDRQTGTAQGSETKATISPALVKQLREETGAGMMDCKKALAETGGNIVKAQEFLRKKGLASADKKASRTTAEGRIGSYIHDNRIGVLIEVNCETDFVSRGEIFKELVDDLAMQVAACPQVRYLVTEDVPEEIVNKEREIEMQKEDLLTKPEQFRSKIVDGRIRKRLEEFALLEQPYIKNDKMVVKDWVKQTIATVGENIKVRRFVCYNLGEGLEKKSQDFAAEVAAQTAAKPSPAAPKNQSAEAKEPVQIAPTVAISAALVKQLREETGAGMMDCKKALTETGGDLEKAQEYLRKKGLSSADKKSSRLAAEGRISSYIHDSRIGALIEVNSETDFVGRNERFKELVDDLAMQIVACPQVEFVSIEDIPESIMNKEKEIEMQREELQSKPENIREKIVAGRISKRLGELALLEQPFIKDDSMLVKDLVKQTVAALGENIKVRRFVRFTLGENKA